MKNSGLSTLFFPEPTKLQCTISIPYSFWWISSFLVISETMSCAKSAFLLWYFQYLSIDKVAYIVVTPITHQLVIMEMSSIVSWRRRMSKLSSTRHCHPFRTKHPVLTKSIQGGGHPLADHCPASVYSIQRYSEYSLWSKSDVTFFPTGLWIHKQLSFAGAIGKSASYGLPSHGHKGTWWRKEWWTLRPPSQTSSKHYEANCKFISF